MVIEEPSDRSSERRREEGEIGSVIEAFGGGELFVMLKMIYPALHRLAAEALVVVVVLVGQDPCGMFPDMMTSVRGAGGD